MFSTGSAWLLDSAVDTSIIELGLGRAGDLRGGDFDLLSRLDDGRSRFGSCRADRFVLVVAERSPVRLRWLVVSVVLSGARWGRICWRLCVSTLLWC